MDAFQGQEPNWEQSLLLAQNVFADIKIRTLLSKSRDNNHAQFALESIKINLKMIQIHIFYCKILFETI